MTLTHPDGPAQSSRELSVLLQEICQLWIGELRWVDVKLDHCWAVRVAGFPVTHSTGFRIDLLARSN